MVRRRIFPATMVMALCWAWFGCLPDPMYPDEPTLAVERFVTHSDGTATLTLRFTDGDGNVGLTQADTLPPFCATCEHHFNLVGEYQEWENETWNVPNLLVPFAYRVPVAEPTGSSPALDGTIDLALTSWHLVGTSADSVRFTWTLWDRDLNPSNEAVTDALAVP
ncbi:MAG: hypothetical protein O2990_01420 [Bacteroidetes bacterium]|nr:hypothetical protein [Bacteroidota bacterium]